MSEHAKKKQIPVDDLMRNHLQVNSGRRLSDEMYRYVFFNVGIGIAIISSNMEIIAINKQMENWYPNIDISQKPICYKTFNDPPQDAVCSYCPSFLTFQDGKIHNALTKTPLENHTKNFRIISSPIKNAQGKVIAVIEMVEDVTEHIQAKRQLEISENMYRTLFENTGTINVLLDEDTTIVLANAEFERKIGYSRKEVEGCMSVLTWIPTQYHKQALNYHSQRREKTHSVPRQYEIKIINRAGELRDVLINVDMIPGTKRSIASLMDITELHQSEEAIRKQKNELEDKARRLEEANTALRVLLRQRAEDQSEIEAKIVTNVKELIVPYLEDIKKKNQNALLLNSIQTLETNLNNIISPFLKKLTLQYANLTSREVQIANLVKDGKSTKEIADILNCSIRAVEFHRNNIRKVLGLNKSKANLRSYLLSLS
jgi:PAS domain S-box-containing protein